MLFALLSDPEGVVYPLLHHLGVNAEARVRDQVDQALDRIPKVYAQGRRPRSGSRRPPASCSRRPAAEAEALTDEYISTEHLLLALLDVGDSCGRAVLKDAGLTRDGVLGGARRGARPPARHRPEPGGEVPGAARRYGRDLTEQARAASSTR